VVVWLLFGDSNLMALQAFVLVSFGAVASAKPVAEYWYAAE
jgi:hypothetical protein